MNRQAFKVRAKLITKGPCRGFRDDTGKQPKRMEGVEERLDQDVLLIQVCTCKVMREGKKNPNELTKRNRKV
jgi:hypothetical protein|uniref:Uncharacterized protein n=1 Tax=Picea glauca TaxID=3330 RepID=A0A101M2N5_PICGL|nr:hypothetical protein ABT39_MTgene3167 [Picea glauca]QHR89058.1 hypothetical protein Q903MT_gene3077 [Picea sitchensis]